MQPKSNSSAAAAHRALSIMRAIAQCNEVNIIDVIKRNGVKVIQMALPSLTRNFYNFAHRPRSAFRESPPPHTLNT